ncbi:alternative oxidase, mitochondrial [Acrasis kona]|uniref:Alternative oxidase, mitochondrial n=1 Tax=Acrasis kona TaxID=1008807 RepID=A0AAW2YXC2_9EUKA
MRISSSVALRTLSGSRIYQTTRYVPIKKLYRPYSTMEEKSIAENNTEDKSRVDEAMRVRKEFVKENADGFTKPSGDIYKNSKSSVDFGDDYNLPHPLWNHDYVWNVQHQHTPPANLTDKLALWTIRTIRFNFDWMSGWMWGRPTINKALNRVCFLESIAGVPGSVGGLLRHLHSLRRMRRDNGWIHTLMEEAENERMHLLVYLKQKEPGLFFRSCVWVSQGIFFNFFFLSYLVSPTFCHRLVGYLEEEAFKTYTHILEEIQNGTTDLTKWKNTPAPEIAIKYWKLPENSTMLDVVAHTRADEAHHRDVNHAFAGLNYSTDANPYMPGH